MSTNSTVTNEYGTATVSRTETGDLVATVTPAHSHFNVGIQSDKPLDGASFIAGLMLGALFYFIIQSAMRWHARREVRSTKRAAAIGPQTDARDQDGMAAAVAALARRTATLETIVTDPAQRTAREIDALR